MMIKCAIQILIIASLPISALAQPGPIKNERYNDDFAYLLNDTIQKKGLEKLKFISLGKEGKSSISFGGELREWYEFRENPNFGDLPPGTITDPNGALLHRAMIHADLRLGKRLRFFGQLNNTLEFGNPNPPVPEIIEDGLGLHQAFAEFELGRLNNSKHHSLRFGRQEYSFGNELLVSSREGPNNRQAFDGITYSFEDSTRRIQTLAAVPIIIKPDVFDNVHGDEVLWGVYSTWRRTKQAKVDLYYLAFYSEQKSYNFEPGFQHRHAIGARLWNHGRTFWYDLEAMYQTGQFNQLNINAVNFTGEVRYVFQKKFWKPMIGLGLSYISGDYNSNDGQLNTFDAMYPKPVYGLATPLGPSNVAHVQPMFGVQPLERFFVNVRWYYLMRTSNQDGTYAPGMAQVRPSPETNSNHHGIGIQYSTDIVYIISKNLTFLTFISYVEPGEYVKDTGAGKSVFFWASMLQFKF